MISGNIKIISVQTAFSQALERPFSRSRIVMKAPRSKPGPEVEELAKLCHEARRRRRKSVAKLAAAAQVGSATIVALENPKELARRIRSQRTAESLPRSFARIALALEEPDPLEWLRKLGAARKQAASEGELQKLLDDERCHLQGVPRGKGTMAEIRATINRPDDPEHPVSAFLLTCGKDDRPQRDYYRRFTELVLHSISPKLRLEEVEPDRYPTITEMMAALTGGRPTLKLIVGLWSMVGRARYPVSFTQLPGWAHSLSCLTLAQSSKGGEDARLTWDQIRDRETARRLGLEVVCVEGEAAHLYLSSFCGYKDTDLVLLGDYKMEEVADEFAKRLQTRPQSALVIGEYEGRTIRNRVYRRHKVTLGDMAALSFVPPPRYPLSVCTAEEDVIWTRTIRQAIRELYTNAPALIVELHTDYVIAVLKECLGPEGNLGREDPRIILGELFPEGGRRVPGYIQVVEPDFPVPDSFRQTMRETMRRKLSETLSRAGAAQEEKTIARWVLKIMPWIRTPVERILVKIKQLDGKLSRLGKWGEKSREGESR